MVSSTVAVVKLQVESAVCVCVCLICHCTCRSDFDASEKVIQALTFGKQ